MQFQQALPGTKSFAATSDMGFAYRCEWNNTENVAVSFGEGYYDEMCFLWHYHYPGQGFHLCTDFLCHTP